MIGAQAHRNTQKVALCVLAVVLSSATASEETHLQGQIAKITSVPDGIYLMLDAGVPNVCSGTPYGWLLVHEDDTALQWSPWC